MSTKIQSILALVAALGFVVLITLQALELSHYGKPGPEAVQTAVAAPATTPAPETEAAPAAPAAEDAPAASDAK